MAPGRTRTRETRRGLLRGWASEPRPPNHHPPMRGRREVCAGQDRPIVITVAASDPILLAVAHGALALTSRDSSSKGSPSDPLASTVPRAGLHSALISGRLGSRVFVRFR